jgi:thiol:disulfide interchange protein
MKRFYCLLLFFLGIISPVFAQEVYQAHTHVRLVSEQNAVVPGRTFWVGLDVIPDDGWHVYWKNPGDAGLPLRIKWQLPSGIKAGDIYWPYPKRINEGPLTSFVYEHEVFLLVPITVDKNFQPSKNVNLHARVTWLACKSECILGRAELNLSLPVETNISGVTFNSFKALFDQTRRNLPSHEGIDHAVQTAPVRVPILVACLFALIGGLILNLMPCVLPVLSIKVLHLVERHPDRKIVLRHSLIYALGILVSVWALALLLFILKAAGQFAGWGFQFQSPVFVIIVALILFVFALNLFGVFEFSFFELLRVSGKRTTIGGVPASRLGYQASFISGVITTVVASPCTAPFMGTALTVGLSQPGIVGFGIFTFLGLGLALPFVLLSAFPFLLSFVPRPGPWMVHLKKALGLILLACVIWLLWVFGIQTGLGDLSKFYKPSHEQHWQSYSSTAVSQARQSGQGVFIDFTAGWCINCQVNDRLVLQNREVVKAFKDKGIILFKADWTKYDPVITRALASFGRDSVPFYVYYPPLSDTPVILPQLITPKVILDRVKGTIIERPKLWKK